MTLETRVTVVRLDNQFAWVESTQGNGCAQCHGKGCGSGKLNQLFCSKPRQFQVDNPIAASVGDAVIVCVAEGAVMQGVGWVYLLPLCLLVIGAIWGNGVSSVASLQDAYSAGGALLGLIIGYAITRYVSLHFNRLQNRPYISKKLSAVQQ